MRYILTAALLCLPTLAIGQVKITQSPAVVLSGISDIREMGSLVLVPTDDEIKLESVTIIRVETEANNISCKAWVGESRTRADLERVDTNTFVLRQPGTYWVDVIVFDGPLNIFADESLRVTVKPSKANTTVDIVEPTEPLKSSVAKIGGMLKTDPEKAGRVVNVFAGFSTAIKGAAGKRVTDVGRLGQINAIALKDLAMASGVMIGNEIQEVLRTHVGIKTVDGESENRALTDADRIKIAEVYAAVAWAGMQ